LKGFVPRGKDTLTSRLFVLERVKNELEKQLATAKLADKKKRPSTTTTLSSSILNKNDAEDDEVLDYEDNLAESHLLEDLKSNPDSCAFLSSNEYKCLTNEQVYHLINNQSDLMKIPKPIEQQIHKPNEQMCTSIDLSSLLIFPKFFKNSISI
jgi:hypothetical protein